MSGEGAQIHAGWKGRGMDAWMADLLFWRGERHVGNTTMGALGKGRVYSERLLCARGIVAKS